MGSLVVAHRLSCPMACGILVRGPGIKPTSSALSGGFLTTDYQGSPRVCIFFQAKRDGFGPWEGVKGWRPGDLSSAVVVVP